MIVCWKPIQSNYSPYRAVDESGEPFGPWIAPSIDPTNPWWELSVWFECPNPIPDYPCYYNPINGVTSSRFYALAPDAKTVHHCADFTGVDSSCTPYLAQWHGWNGLTGPEVPITVTYLPEPFGGLFGGLVALLLLFNNRKKKRARRSGS